MLLLKNRDFSVSSLGGVVSAEDASAVRSAGEIIAAAEAEAAAIREDARKEFEEERKRGYAKGIEDGKMEIAMQKLDLVDSSVAFMESVETKMAEVVMKALRNCVTEIGDKAMVVEIVKKTLAAVIRTQRNVTLKVAPSVADEVRSKVEELRGKYPTIEVFDVVEDPRLEATACVLETEAGVADASVSTQLAAIEKSLRKHLSGEH